ncbi:MAG: putative mariner transposase, partial [Streblomastix strix]
YTKVSKRWVPYTLSAEQKQKRVQMAEVLYGDIVNESGNNYANLATMNESWMYFEYLIMTQWVPAGTARPQAARTTIHTKKIMLRAVLTGTEFWLLDFKTEIGGIDLKYFTEVVLSAIQDDMRILLESLIDRVRLHMDNAPSYNSKATNWFLTESIFERIPHPLYSPDLAPCDFWLFEELKGMMRGKKFAELNELSQFCSDFTESQNADKLKSVYEECERCCIQDGLKTPAQGLFRAPELNFFFFLFKTK